MVGISSRIYFFWFGKRLIMGEYTVNNFKNFRSIFINDTCPLSGQIFDFALNPNIIIPVTPGFYNHRTQRVKNNKNCNWNFIKSSETQLFKIVVKSFYSGDPGFKLHLNVDDQIVKKLSLNSSVNC
jgi:hypothetical protein